jgi:hypothetical protein
MRLPRLSAQDRNPAGARIFRVWIAALLCCAALGVCAQGNRNLAPGFTELPANARILVTPVDVELYSISGGGIPEPRADWTAAAQANMKKELGRLRERYKGDTIELDERAADEFGELLTLHSAVARSINLHHGIGGIWALPTKDGKLDWSFGDALRPLQEKSGARYALFVWVRDSYASAERVAAMVFMAALGVGISGGSQQGYASLVDLQTGQVLWFNHLARASGDLREAAKAAETVDVLLAGFPAAR